MYGTGVGWCDSSTTLRESSGGGRGIAELLGAVVAAFDLRLVGECRPHV